MSPIFLPRPGPRIFHKPTPPDLSTFQQILTATLSSLSTVQNQVSKLVSATVTSTATLAKLRCAFANRTATVTSTASFIKQVNKKLTATVETVHKEDITMSERLGDGIVIARGKLYALSFQGASGTNLYTWNNPLDASAFSSNNIDSVNNSYASLCYDSASDALFGGIAVDGSSGSQSIYIYSDTKVGQFAFPFGTVSDLFASNGAVTSDGTYYYALLQNALANSYVLKFRQSDGAFISSIQLPSPSGGTAFNGTIILAGLDGFLYIGGVGTPAWVGRVADDLSSASLITLPAPFGTLDDDAVIIGSNVWYASESPGQSGKFVKVAKDLSSTTVYSTGAGQGCDGMYYDGTSLWISHLGNPGKVVKVDPATGSVLSTTTITGAQAINEIFVLDDHFVLTTYQAASHVIVWPFYNILQKQVNKFLSAFPTTTATLATLKVFIQALTATITTTATNLKLVLKNQTAISTTTTTLVKLVNKLLSSTSTTTATEQRQVNNSLSNTVTSTASLQKTMPRLLTATATTTANIVATFIAFGGATVARLRTLLGMGT